MCAYVAEPTERRKVRRALISLLEGGEHRLHMKDERDSRKRLVLSTLGDLGVQASVFTSLVSPQHEARARIMQYGIWPTIRARDVERLVFEAEEGQNERDRRLLFNLAHKDKIQDVFSYHHSAPYSEPMLWVPDAIAWAYSKGGEWRQRAAGLVDKVLDVDDL